jgi:predicted RNA binding protein YcfA (HicA-like mRNA interferase family)
MAKEYGWALVSVKGDHFNFKHTESRFIVTIVHQKDKGTGKNVTKIRLFYLT